MPRTIKPRSGDEEAAIPVSPTRNKSPKISATRTPPPPPSYRRRRKRRSSGGCSSCNKK